jgi:multimeric flavodoxin WrbA
MTDVDRRSLLKAAGAVAVAGAFGAEAGAEAGQVQKIIGISGSPRKGRTTAEAVQIALAAAQESVPGLQVEFIDLAEFRIPGNVAAGIPLAPGEQDDFSELLPRLNDPSIIGIIIGSPVYFGNMSALCKAFLDRCMALRSDGFKWRNKVAGVMAVGNARNGGQELTIASIKIALQGQDVLAVGTGAPSVRIGASLWNQEDSIAGDTLGMDTAKDLGRNVAAIATRLWPLSSA